MTDQPIDPALDARVRGVLAERFPGATVAGLAPLEGGHSGHTLVADLEGAELDGGPLARVVVKAGAPGRPAKGRHDVLRQARVLDAVGADPAVAVPRVLASSDGDPQVFVMTMEPGGAVEPVLDGVGDLAPDRVAARARAIARMLGHLHAIDPAATPLAGTEPLTVRAELARWSTTIRVVDPSLVVGAEELIARLEASIPTELPPRIVHGDYRLGNILCDGDRPTGIIDWEIWSLTDPRIDLGWLLLFCDRDEFPEISFPAPGMLGIDDLLAEYEAVAGPVADARWFLAFARLKMAAIMGHNLKRHREGRYHDPYQETLPPTIASMVVRGLEVTAGGRPTTPTPLETT